MRLGEIMLPLYPGKPPLKYCASLWAPNFQEICRPDGKKAEDSRRNDQISRKHDLERKTKSTKIVLLRQK